MASSISNIRFFPRQGNGVLATVKFTVGEIIEVKGAIMQNAKGTWVSLPGKYYEATNKDTNQKEKKWDAEVQAVSPDKAKELQDTILAAYKTFKPANGTNTGKMGSKATATNIETW